MSHTKQYELIIERAKDMQIIQMEEDLLGIMMDLESADETFHVRWDDLLAADDFNFVHVFAASGITSSGMISHHMISDTSYDVLREIGHDAPAVRIRTRK